MIVVNEFQALIHPLTSYDKTDDPSDVKLDFLGQMYLSHARSLAEDQVMYVGLFENNPYALKRDREMNSPYLVLAAQLLKILGTRCIVEHIGDNLVVTDADLQGQFSGVSTRNPDKTFFERMVKTYAQRGYLLKPETDVVVYGEALGECVAGTANYVTYQRNRYLNPMFRFGEPSLVSLSRIAPRLTEYALEPGFAISGINTALLERVATECSGVAIDYDF